MGYFPAGVDEVVGTLSVTVPAWFTSIDRDVLVSVPAKPDGFTIDNCTVPWNLPMDAMRIVEDPLWPGCKYSGEGDADILKSGLTT